MCVCMCIHFLSGISYSCFSHNYFCCGLSYTPQRLIFWKNYPLGSGMSDIVTWSSYGWKDPLPFSLNQEELCNCLSRLQEDLDLVSEPRYWIQVIATIGLCGSYSKWITQISETSRLWATGNLALVSADNFSLVEASSLCVCVCVCVCVCIWERQTDWLTDFDF
jgi:hypothetical protein